MSKKIPMRQCIGCGEMKNKREMMRVLKTAEDGIILDVTGKKNGRGAYLCQSKECMEKARKTKGEAAPKKITKARTKKSVVSTK